MKDTEFELLGRIHAWRMEPNEIEIIPVPPQKFEVSTARPGLPSPLDIKTIYGGPWELHIIFGHVRWVLARTINELLSSPGAAGLGLETMTEHIRLLARGHGIGFFLKRPEKVDMAHTVKETQDGKR